MDNLNARIQEALELIDKEQYQDAAKVLEEVRAANADHHDALFLLGCIYAEHLHKVDRARELLERRIKLYPQEGDAYYVLAELELKAGNNKRALELYEQAIGLGTEVAEGHYNAGVSCRRLTVQAYEEGRESEFGDFMDRAFEHWSEAVRLAPMLVPARVNLGCCYLNLGQYDEALTHFNEALRLAPEDLDAWKNKLLVYAKKSDFPKIVTTMNEMRERGPIPGANEEFFRRLERYARNPDQVTLNLDAVTSAPPGWHEEVIDTLRDVASAVRRAASVATANVPVADHVFRWDGDGWVAVFGGITSHYPDAKGMHYLHQLLAHPGQEFRAMELARLVDGWLGEDPSKTASVSRQNLGEDGLVETDLTDAGEVMDDKYLKNVKERLNEIDEEIAAARQREDTAAEEQLDRERDTILRLTAAARGLRGTKRKADDPHEKARQRAGASIRRAKNVVRKKHPALYEHLRAVNTGRIISYQPDRPIIWITD